MKGKAGSVDRQNHTVLILKGPRAICGDREVPVEPHSEDYSRPYRWEPPAVYALCRDCHRNKLHKRFSRLAYWEAFKAHVRRGGYARDLWNPEVSKEFESFRWTAGRGERAHLRQLRPREVTGTEWWERLSVDPGTMTSRAARPRP